jgi:hypothetical protein
MNLFAGTETCCHKRTWDWRPELAQGKIRLNWPGNAPVEWRPKICQRSGASGNRAQIGAHRREKQKIVAGKSYCAKQGLDPASNRVQAQEPNPCRRVRTGYQETRQRISQDVRRIYQDVRVTHSCEHGRHLSEKGNLWIERRKVSAREQLGRLRMDSRSQRQSGEWKLATRNSRNPKTGGTNPTKQNGDCWFRMRMDLAEQWMAERSKTKHNNLKSLRSRKRIREKMRSTSKIQKSIFSLRFKQDYNWNIEVTILPPSFDYWNKKI